VYFTPATLIAAAALAVAIALVVNRTAASARYAAKTANEDYFVLAHAGFRYVTVSGLRRYDGDTLLPDDVEVRFPRGTTMVRWLLLSATKWVDMRNLHPRLLRGDRGRPAVRLGGP
jgi:hypothetical protein